MPAGAVVHSPTEISSHLRRRQPRQNMRRTASEEDPSVTRPLKFSIGSDEENQTEPEKPPHPKFFHRTTPPPSRAHRIINRILFRIFPRILFVFLILIIAIALLPGGWHVALCAANIIPPPLLRRGENITLIGHRGCEFPYPENSLHGLKYAAKEVGFVEIDIAITSDNVVIAMHDEYYGRTTNGTGLICRRPYDYVKQLRLNMPERDPTGRIAQGKFCYKQNMAGQFIPCTYRVPTLEQIFDDLPDNTRFMLDIKACYTPGISADSPTCSNCTALLAQTKNAMQKYAISPERVVFTSNEPESLRVFEKGMLPGSTFALGMDGHFASFKRDRFTELAVNANWSAVSMYVGLASLRPDFVKVMRTSVIPGTEKFRDVYAWTVRRDYEYRLARCAGISNIIVAQPGHVRKRFSFDLADILAQEEPID